MKKTKFEFVFSVVAGLFLGLGGLFGLGKPAHALDGKNGKSHNHNHVTMSKAKEQSANNQQSHSIWNDLRADFNLDYSNEQAEIIKQRHQYLSHDYELDVIIKRSEPFLEFIREEIKKRHLPAELVLLPLLESQYDPLAVSHKSAAGLWQIMPATGKILGLVQNNGYDGRHDIYASTKAALNHLVHLNKKFNGDWLITLAAYNAGEGTIGRLIERNRAAGKPTDFWSLPIPSTETRLYVPRFLALVDIVENADKYNFALPAISNDPALVHVKLTNPLHLNQAAKMTGMSVDELRKYNPGINANATATALTHHLLLPVTAAQPQKIALLHNAHNAPPTAIG